MGIIKMNRLCDESIDICVFIQGHREVDTITTITALSTLASQRPHHTTTTTTIITSTSTIGSYIDLIA